MDFAKRHGSADLLMKFALGKVEESPFDQKAASNLKREVIESLSSKGYYMKSSPRDRTDIPIDFRFLELLLEASGDPEVGLGIFARGVRVGPGVRLPRLPALYAKKKRWQLPEQRFPEDPDVANYDEDSVWRSNYSSLEPLSDKVREVLEDHANRGQVLKLSEDEARKRYPNLVVASSGAQSKDKKDGSYTARDTNGISVNKRIRVRDQERSPIAADIKRLLREKAKMAERTFALTADVAEAHRQVPIDPVDWHFLGSQISPGEAVYVNTVGTFGISSASYYWSRVGSALGRLSQYLSRHTAHTWHLLVADDFHLKAGGAGYREALMTFFVLCYTAVVPLSWGKTSGGDTIAWVGFEILHRSYSLGITARRAEWFVKWSENVASAVYINMDSFEEV